MYNEGEYDLQMDIDTLIEEIAQIDAEIVIEQSLADKFKALLDAALAG